MNRQSDWSANFEQRMLSFFDELYVLQKQSARGKKGSAVKTLRSAYGVLSGIANYLLHFADMLELIPLVELFEQRINDWKRSSGILTFADVSSLALRILIEHPDIRCAEKKRISAIMIDEFQDNNEDQRDMLFLLAEKNVLKYPSSFEVSRQRPKANHSSRAEVTCPGIGGAAMPGNQAISWCGGNVGWRRHAVGRDSSRLLSFCSSAPLSSPLE